MTTLPQLDEAAARRLLKRSEAAHGRLDRYTTVWRDIMRFAMPHRDTMSGYAEGQERTTAIYDSTACYGAPRFANRVVQNMFPAQEAWAALTLPIDTLEALGETDRQPLQQRLEAATKLLFRHVRESNFDLSIVEAAHDLAAGTMALLVERGQAAGGYAAPLLRFQSVPIGSVACEDGPFGGIGAVFHKQRMAARLVMQTYPDATLPDGLQRVVDRTPEKDVELLHAVVHEPNQALWRIAVLWKHRPIVERSARSCPWIIVRWMRAAGEVYGYGPLTLALPDIRTLNKTTELTLQNAAMSISGAYTGVDDGVLNPATARIVPGAIIPVAANGGPRGASLALLGRQGNFDVSQIVTDDLRRGIRQALYDIPLPDQVRSNVSATEIAERMADYNQQTGSFGRLYTDGTRPLMFRIVDILDEAGVLPRMFDEMAGGTVRAIPTSPLAIMLDMAEVQSVMRFMQFGAAFEAYAPGFIRAGISPERTAALLAELLAVPAQLRTTAEERQAAREADQQRAELELAAKSPAVARVADNLTAPAPARAA